MTTLRPLAALWRWFKRRVNGCEYCGNRRGVRPENSRTFYHFDGDFYAPENPNRDVHLCRSCADEHHAHWDAMWSNYGGPE